MAKQQIGVNAEMEVRGQILTITVDLSKSNGPSKSGKTQMIASTSGFASMAGVGHPEVIVNLNVNKK